MPPFNLTAFSELDYVDNIKDDDNDNNDNYSENFDNDYDNSSNNDINYNNDNVTLRHRMEPLPRKFPELDYYKR